MTTTTRAFLYVTHHLDALGSVPSREFGGLTERHPIDLDPTIVERFDESLEDPEILRHIHQSDATGVVFGVESGVPRRRQLRLARQLLREGRDVFLFWPAEGAAERMDTERVSSYWRLLLTYKVLAKVHPAPDQQELVVTPPAEDPTNLILRNDDRATAVRDAPRPVSLESLAGDGHTQARGVYLRLDHWADISSGGSYGHTCYVANELSRSTRNLLCILGSRFELLDTLGVEQRVVAPSAPEIAGDLRRSGDYYAQWLLPVLEYLRPDFIYERLVLGNGAGAIVSRRLGIPYIVEYNGSELDMARAYSKPHANEAELEAIEDAAFAQASLISVISRRVAESLIARGIDESRILVNPNGVDPDRYRRPDPEARRALRSELGFGDDDVVIGFTGTFGAWHGIDVLADALGRVCQAAPAARWLLIGDGNLRTTVDGAVRAAGIGDRVVRPGRVPQDEGARLLGACDIFVSPHAGDIGSVPFFGSPTKLFEYMACGGAIVASDLEQIGEVLRPPMDLAALESGGPVPDGARAVLVRPGDADELVRAVLGLVGRPEVVSALGRNARQASEDTFSWARHVERLWEAAGPGRVEDSPVGLNGSSDDEHPVLTGDSLDRISTEDRFKDEVQNQWNNNPCGSQYVKEAQRHTLEWYLEAERYRYEEYGPWMREVMEFDQHAGERVLEIGAGMGTDLAQFAANGALVTDCDLSAGHLAHAQENFKLRGLEGEFVHADGERLPFDDETFDVVYSNGVIHHTPNTAQLIGEIHRVLKPGGKTIIMVYAENSLHYWGRLVYGEGVRRGELHNRSIGDLMSEMVELSENDARPLVKVYTASRLRRMFSAFNDVTVVKRQLTPGEVPTPLRPIPLPLLERLMGWNLIIKGYK